MAYDSVTVGSYNSSPPSDDGSTSPTNRITWAGIKTKLTDPLKTALESINTNLIGSLLSMAYQAASAVAISGGTVNGTSVGATTPSTGAFTTLGASGATTLSSTLGVTGAATLSSTLAVTSTITSAGNSVPTTTEGSWTPALKFGGNSTGLTYGTQVGRYITVGNLVTVWGRIVLTSNGSSLGNATITGLPFTSSNVTGLQYSGTVGDYDNVFATGILPYVAANSTTVVFRETDGGGDEPAFLDDGDFDDTGTLSFTLTYRTG